MLKIAAVAEQLNCSIANVYALHNTGRLAFFATGATGKGFRVELSELERFIAESRGHGGEDAPEFSKEIKPAGPFKHLDGDRLLSAWRQRDARASQPNANNAPSSE